MMFRFFIFTLATFVTIGCSTGAVKQDQAMFKKPVGYLQASAQSENEAKAMLLDSNDKDYFVWAYNGRLFVIGDPKTHAEFKTLPHLPYTKTILGAGPNGETVIFEVNKKDPSFADSLKKRFENTPFLLESQGDDYNVWKHKGRIFVIGNKKTNDDFIVQHHLPYTKTVLGIGPFGETVIFEVDKKKPEMADQLKNKYENTPYLLKSEGNDYFVWKYKGRIYVIGNEKTNEDFKKLHHLPYTKTVLGIGPDGETVIFEVDKKNKTLADQLHQRYLQG